MTDATATASASALYVYEFLYRGRAPSDTTPAAYHVILAHDTTDAFGRNTTAFSDAMTADQASAAGFDITTIVSGMNTAAQAANAALVASLADAQAKATAAQANLDAANATIATLTAKVADLSAQLAAPDVQDRIAKMEAQHAAATSA